MQDKVNKPDQQSPPEIAREAFRRLAVRRIAPTPDAYRDIYQEIAGVQTMSGAEQILAEFAASLANASEEAALLGARVRSALESRNWPECGDALGLLAESHFPPQARPPTPAGPAASARATETASASTPPADPPTSRSIPLVDAPPVPISPPSRSISLIDAAPAPDKSRLAAGENGESQHADMLRELLTRTLTLAVGSLLQGAPELADESERLAKSIREATTERALNDASARLKQLCFKIELKSADMAEEHELLLRLFNLLLENVGELLEDDSWLAGQIASVQNALAGPLNSNILNDAARSLKEVIYKQGMLKHSLSEAKVTVKNMMMTFIDRLGAVVSSTADYHEKIDKYSQQISKAQDITQLNRVLDDVMRDTRIAQTEALRSRDQMVEARRDVQDAETRIHDLEAKLKQMSELVREDQLTGSLNRRGLDDVFERELARAERRHTPLCIAMLDLDDFKRLNDTHGHSAGDEALIHLVRVIKDTLRTMDVIARFGGEEFMIVLPDTPLEDAVQTVTRLQRELTKRIFMYNHERLLITFSAGVALRQGSEDQAAMVKRADAALYKAKRAGKNRVIAAD